MKPGIYYNMSREEYDAIEALNPSTVKFALHSMSDCRAVIEDQDGLNESDNMELGSAIDVATLTPDRFKTEYAFYDGTRRGKDYDAFCAANPNTTILKQSDYRTALYVASVIKSHSIAGPMLQCGNAQTCVVWVDRVTGQLCKGMIDYLTDTAIIDLKSYGGWMWGIDARSKQARELNYHVSMGAYQDAIRTITGKTLPVYLIYGQTKSQMRSGRLRAGVAQFQTAELEAGLKSFREGIEKIIKAKDSGDWLDSSDKYIEQIVYPEWFHIGSGDVELTLNGEQVSV